MKSLSRILPGPTARSLALILLAALAAGSCRSVYRNHDPAVPSTQTATLSQSGFVFRLTALKNKVSMSDTLSLKPGDYMIDFQLPSTGDGGVARFVLDAGKVYKFKIVERRYLPEIGMHALVGECAIK